MASEHHLIAKLKGLKLSGMLQSLEMRLSQAQQEHLGYVEFLEILMEDELLRRANQRLAKRVARARFEEIKTLEGFDFGSNPKLPARQIRDLASCEFIERKQWVLFIGPVGVSKTHLLQAIGHQACRLGHSVLYLKTSRLLADLGGGHADGTWESRFRQYLKPDLLLLDDFAMKEFTVQQAEDVYDLIDDRSRMGRDGGLQPIPPGLVSAVSQPGFGRGGPGSLDQQGPPRHHQRQELSAPSAAGQNAEPSSRHLADGNSERAPKGMRDVQSSGEAPRRSPRSSPVPRNPRKGGDHLIKKPEVANRVTAM